MKYNCAMNKEEKEKYFVEATIQELRGVLNQQLTKAKNKYEFLITLKVFTDMLERRIKYNG